MEETREKPDLRLEGEHGVSALLVPLGTMPWIVTLRA